MLEIRDRDQKEQTAGPLAGAGGNSTEFNERAQGGKL